VILKEFQWVVEGLEKSHDPSDWKQSLSTLTFMTTEPYGKQIKEELLVPYLDKALHHENIDIQKVAARFAVSLRVFELLSDSDLDHEKMAETFYEKFLKRKKPNFLDPLIITFTKLKKENKLKKFLEQLGQGTFSQDIVNEISFQLYYRDIDKIKQALEMIYFLTHELKINKEDFKAAVDNFLLDLETRIYLKSQTKIKKELSDLAHSIFTE